MGLVLLAVPLAGGATPAHAQTITGRSGAPAAVGPMARGLTTDPGSISLELRSSLVTGKAHYRQGLRAGIGFATDWELSLGLSHHHSGTSGDGAGVFWGEVGLRSALWTDANFSLLWHLDVRFGNVTSQTGFGSMAPWRAQQLWGTVQGGIELAGVVDDTLEFSLAVAFANQPYVRHQIASGTWCSGGSCESLDNQPIGHVRSGVVGGFGLAGAVRITDSIDLGLDTWLSIPLWAERYASFIDRGLALSLSLSLEFDLDFSDPTDM